MLTVKLTTIGSSTGLIVPKEVLERLNLQEGDSVLLTETPEGYLLTPGSEPIRRQMEIAGDIMRRYRNTLRELAR